MNTEERAWRDAIRKMCGLKIARVDPLPVQASNRRYYRVSTRKDETRVLMKLAAEPTKAEEFTDGGLEIRELPFLEVQRRLEAAGVRVPRVDGYDPELGVILLEDLGDLTLEDYLLRFDAEDFEDYYREAIRLIGALQRGANEIADGSVIEQRRFSEQVLMLELDHFREYGYEVRTGLTMSPRERARFEAISAELVADIRRMPETVVHRDFQSRNLMLVGHELAVIDFQDALIGPYVYDLVALLRDSYVTLERPFVERMLAVYTAGHAEVPEELSLHFDLMTLQRKLKDAGRFVFIDRVKGNADFMRFFEPSLGYVLEALGRLGRYPELADWVRAALAGRRPTEVRA